MREKLLVKLADWHARYPWRMLAVVLVLTVFLAAMAGQLSITTRTSDLLPSGDPIVTEFNRILDEFSTATNLIVVVQGEENRIKAFADELAPKIEDLKDSSQNDNLAEEIAGLEKKRDRLSASGKNGEKRAGLEKEIQELKRRIDIQLFQRVNYRADIDFIREHALILAEADDLKNLKDVFFSPNLVDLVRNYNDSMEKEYVGQEESLSNRQEEDGAFQFLDGIQGLVFELNHALDGKSLSDQDIQAVADRLLFGEPYLLSYDKSVLIMVGIPNFSLMDRGLLMTATESVQSLVDDLLQKYTDLEAGLSGGIAREHDEQKYSQQSLSSTTLIALILILILLIISFRMWVAPVLAVANLIVGLIWSMGAAFLLVGQLNMFTSMMSIVLLGLGIDFSIHLISAFTEWRAAGENIPDALRSAFLKSGKGILTGAVSTACAFLTLIISTTRGLREMGIVTGVGLITIMLATFLFLPVLLVLRARNVEKKKTRTPRLKRDEERDLSFRFLGRIARWLSSHAAYALISVGIVTIILAWSASRIPYDRNYKNMEPKGMVSIELQDLLLEKFDLTTEYALVRTESLEESRRLTEKFKDIASVAMVDDISLYLPSAAEQETRIPHIKDIHNRMKSAPVRDTLSPSDINVLKEEIDRLQMNIMEMQDMAFLAGRDKVDTKCKELVGDPEQENPDNIMRDLLNRLEEIGEEKMEALTAFQIGFAPYFREAVIQMTSTEPIAMADLPSTIRDRYSSRDGSQFLMSVYPAGDLWGDPQYLDRFVDDLKNVSEKATGSGPLIEALLKVFGRDGRNAVLLTLVIVFLLLWWDFKKPLYALAAMVPLAIGIIWMVGIMNLISMPLSIMNIMGLPLIIGIGIDDGVHIMHRWLSEGRKNVKVVFSSTGKAIFLTSLTTMLAFGSLVFSIMPAWFQFGGTLHRGRQLFPRNHPDPPPAHELKIKKGSMPSNFADWKGRFHFLR